MEQFTITPNTRDMNLLCPKNDERINRIGQVCFILIRHGGARVEIDGHGILLHEGSFVFQLPNVLLRVISQTSDLRFGYLSFTFDYLIDFPLLIKPSVSEQAIKVPVRDLDDKGFRLIDKYFNLINDRMHSNENSQSIIKGLLFALIMEVNSLYTSACTPVEISRPDKLADRFFQLLHQNFKKERHIAFYAKQLCISVPHLMRTLKQKTGQTFHFWLTDFMIREMKQQIRSTDKSFQEISEDLNFPNSSYFTRFFRKYAGMTPMAFKYKR